MDKIIPVIIQVFETYGIAAVVIIVAIIILWIFSKKIIDKLSDMVVERLDKIHKQSLEARKKNTPKLKEQLNNLLLDTEANRILLFEYHNGGSNLTGMQFLHSSVTMEVDKFTTAPIGLLINDVHLSMIPNLVSDLSKSSIIYIKDMEEVREKYPYFYNVFTNNGSKQVMFCAIEGIKNSIGFLCLLFNGKTPIDDMHISNILNKNLQKISTMLDFNK